MRKAGHIHGAMPIMLGLIADRVAEIPKDKPILLYCRSGNKSGIATNILRKTGITNIINLSGGINEWIKAGLPIEYSE
jgi:rhodanese-related sulfurtransferase